MLLYDKFDLWSLPLDGTKGTNLTAGAGAKGNDGVAATVQNTKGGIGYVENAYATQNHLVTVQLRNKAGNFVQPTLEGTTAAADGGVNLA